MKEKEKDWELELNLNRITMTEEYKFPDTKKDYRNFLISLLQIKELYLFEDDLKKRYETENIEKISESHPHIIRTGARRKNKDGTFSQKYLDLSPVYFVQRKDAFYDYFFACKLRQLDLLEVDSFLEYHLLNYYDVNFQKFSRFLRICSRKYQTKLFAPEIIQTVNDWIEIKEKEQQELQGTDNKNLLTGKKGRVKREASDKLTSLSQEQTVLLMYYLQQERVFLKDEYLTDLDAGKAFEILTGYSQHTLRQKLNTILHSKQNKVNLTEIDHLLTRLKIAIDKALKGK